MVCSVDVPILAVSCAIFLLIFPLNPSMDEIVGILEFHNCCDSHLSVIVDVSYYCCFCSSSLAKSKLAVVELVALSDLESNCCVDYFPCI